MIDPYGLPLTNRLAVPEMFMSFVLFFSHNDLSFSIQQNLWLGFVFTEWCFGPKKRSQFWWYTHVLAEESYLTVLTVIICAWALVLSGFGTLWLLAGEPPNQLQNWDFWQLLHLRKQISFFSLSLTHPWQPSYGWWISIKQNRRDPTKLYKNCTYFILSNLMVLLFCVLARSPTGYLKR